MIDFNKSKYDICKENNLKTDKELFSYVMNYWQGNESKCHAWLKKYNVDPKSTETISYMENKVGASEKINQSYQATKFIVDNIDNETINKTNEQKLTDYICEQIMDDTVKYESIEDRQTRVNKQNEIVDHFNELISADKILDNSSKQDINTDLNKFMDQLNDEIKFDEKPQGYIFNNYKERE